ncbi:hypothetical protein GGH94_001946, partial [Coemansia aciculifera]
MSDMDAICIEAYCGDSTIWYFHIPFNGSIENMSDEDIAQKITEVLRPNKDFASQFIIDNEVLVQERLAYLNNNPPLPGNAEGYSREKLEIDGTTIFIHKR